jgi:hypothetical protein
MIAQAVLQVPRQLPQGIILGLPGHLRRLFVEYVSARKIFEKLVLRYMIACLSDAENIVRIENRWGFDMCCRQRKVGKRAKILS